MNDIATTTAISAGTGFFGWLFGKLQTPREKKKTDLQLINEAISPLLASIKDLTSQISEMTSRLIEEQDKNLTLTQEKSEWKKERIELVAKIDKLEKTVNCLNRKINELIKSEK